MEVLSGFMVFIVVGLVWAIPLLGIAKSTRTEGGVKALWFLATIFVSWFVWILYLLLVPKKPSIS